MRLDVGKHMHDPEALNTLSFHEWRNVNSATIISDTHLPLCCVAGERFSLIFKKEEEEV